MNTENILDNNVKFFIQMAVQKHQSGQWDEAELLYKQILELKPDLENQYHPIASSNLGSIFEQQGFLDAAVKLYQQALRLKPDYAEAHYNLGNVLKKQGFFEAALESYQQALKIQPEIAEAHNNLGTVLQKQGFLDAALQSYQRALELQPNYAQAHNNLGNVFQQQGFLDAALKSYQQALNIKPDYAQAYDNLGNVFLQKGKLEEAVESFFAALKIKPNLPSAHHNLGNALKLQGKLEAAVKSYEQAISLNPNYAEAHQNLGNTLYEQGYREAAIASYHQVLELQPDFAPALFGIAIGQLPIIYSSSAEIDIKRNNYQQHLLSLVQSYKQASPKKQKLTADALGSLQPFYLAYQGLNDRDLQLLYGEMIVGSMSSRYPQWSQHLTLPQLAANEKIRIGFVSRFFYNHSNWKIPIQGWVENLDRNEFELFGYHTDIKRDSETVRAAKVFDKFTQGLLKIEQWCELIQKDKLHILIFPEFGMDPMTVKLGCLRLAPIQMTSWGHPNTSGLPTIDYYLSSDLMEPENAQEYYKEKLVRLPNLSIYYTPLDIKEQAISKEEIGIVGNEIMFWCCQALFKYLPQHDDVFPRIASYLGSCKFAFIKYDKGEYVTNTFEQRLSRAFQELGLNYQDYCVFLPHMNSSRFAGMAARADVFLDSIGWSGCNSTLEALAHNVPTVTLPGNLMRGRHTMAMLKMMGIEETIAATKDEYVQMAVRLGQDAEYRQRISQQIAENKYKLYGDLKPVKALSDFFRSAVGKSRSNQSNRDNVIKSDVQSLIDTAIEKHQLGKLSEAESLYKQVLQIQPNHLFAQVSYSELLQAQSKLDEAIVAYQKVLNLKPNSIIAAGTLNNLGNILKEQSKLEAAVESYQQALQLDPNQPSFYHNLGTALCDQGQLEAGIEAFQQALNIEPDFAPAIFGSCMSQLAIIYSSVDEIQLRRNNYEQRLQYLANHYQVATPEERKEAAKAIGLVQPFYLAYQGLNDRPLQLLYGQIIAQLMSSRYPQWSQPIALPQLAANEKIRIGFVSKFFYNHSNWKIPIQGWVENLDRSEFELFAYHTDSKRDRETKKAAQLFDKFTQKSLQLEQWCELIQKDNLHILIFPEFGIDPMTLQLGCLRLAPIQISSWGHPNTSGLPTIDYYLSSDLMEPENAQEHYTEQLVRLPNLSIHYKPLVIQPQARCLRHATAIAKKEIGIDDDEIMFWSCQSLYKYLPQHDDVFPRIASELRCKFVFLEAPQGKYITEVFCQRLNYAFKAFGLNYQDYCIFLPRMDTSTFANTTAIADVFLDSIGWSGCNSTLESIAHNIPVVTLPGDLMRGRHTLAMLKMMGIEETIAATKEDYVKIAVRLGQDAAYRQHISKLVASNKHKLYDDLKPVRALEDFFFNAVNKSRRFAKEEVADILQLAVQYQRANRLAEAEQLYHQALEKHPDHPEALYSLGMLAQQLGQPQTALKWLSAAILVQPDVKTWFSLGNLHFAQREFPEAARAYRQALILRPDALPIYNNLGYALQQQGLFDEAINYYQKALELKPDFIEASANLGNVLHAQGKLSSEQQLHYAQLNNKLGLQSKKALDLKTAIIYYRQALALEPDLVEAHYNLGVALQEQDELEAIACYQRVLELNPNYAEVYFNLAQYQQQNDLEKAISNYRQGLELINPCYAKALSDRGSEIPQELPVTPPIPQTEVKIGNHRFPAIPGIQQEQGKRPFWSVVIPVYATENRRQYLLQCLASVLMQWRGHSEMEILLIDDASVPPLYDLVNAIGGGIIRYYRNPANMGAYRNFNIGVALSRGQWIHLLHDDDYVLPGFYDRLKQSLEGCPESIGAAFTGYENINETGKVVFTQQVYGKYQGIALDFLQRIGVANPLNMPAVVISRKVHEHLGGYLPELNYTGDWEFYKRIAAFYDWWCEPEILARYRQHTDNITTESILSGSKGTCLRRAIEVSEDYIPQEITAKSRSHHFNYCLKEAAIPLQFGKVDGALRMVREALIIDRSTEAMAKLFAWLKQDEVAALRDEIASKFLRTYVQITK